MIKIYCMKNEFLIKNKQMRRYEGYTYFKRYTTLLDARGNIKIKKVLFILVVEEVCVSVFTIT